MQVVPLVGTWIEIFLKRNQAPTMEVVPLVGTWIEIDHHPNLPKMPYVVPLVGTWIEIICGLTEIVRDTSCPSWARGLKL